MLHVSAAVRVLCTAMHVDWFSQVWNVGPPEIAVDPEGHFALVATNCAPVGLPTKVPVTSVHDVGVNDAPAAPVAPVRP